MLYLIIFIMLCTAYIIYEIISNRRKNKEDYYVNEVHGDCKDFNTKHSYLPSRSTNLEDIKKTAVASATIYDISTGEVLFKLSAITNDRLGVYEL